MMEEKLLEQTLKMRNPVLFLGAGFSRGSLVGKKELPVGETLRKNIFDEFYKKEHLKKLKILEEDYAEIEKYELAELCGNINAESDERKKELIKFLVDTFKGAQVKKSDPFHKLLIEYNWKCIYTLNIDDLVENIYEASDKILCVQNEKIRKCFCEGTTQLVKIHGCVRKPELGFVFGKDEYQDSIQQENFKLRMFAQDFFDSDVIFVGTEFNEEDILYLINKYKKSGSRSNGSNYYFIAPKIKNKLKNLIKNNENFYFIPWTAKEFLVKCAKISNDTDMIFEKEKILKQYHFQKIKEYTDIMKYYTSELYYGRYPVWSDFVEEWDVAFQEKEQCFDWVEEDCDSKIVAVVGGAYVGKTVFARRLLFDLHKKGYEAYEYDFKSSLELRLLKEYIELLPIGSNIAILVEDAAMQYKQIVDFMSNKPTNIGKIVFILVSKAYYHDMKKHEMIGTKFKEIVIKSKMNYNMANNVFDRLKEKRRLGELNRYGSTDSEKIKFIKERASIIDVLYRLFHGRGFEEYFSECYKQLNVQEVYRSFFDEICVLYRMGFENYPKELQVMLPGGVDIRKFLNEFEDIIVKDDRENLQIRCAEVFENIVCNKLSSSQKKEIILKYLYSFVGLFDEGEENEWNIFFEKLLKTDALMHKVKLNNDDIEEIFALLETKYDRISYYWMQRGLFVQKLDQFENANTFLNNAQQIQKRSYQIRHALAKNEMEWAVFELRDQYYGSAAYHYEKGERMFLELINSPKYSRALGYSIHSYVNLKIEYFKNYHEVLSDEAINDLYEYLIQVAMIDYSDAVCQAVKKTYDYCVAKNISTDITEKFQDNNFKQYKALYKQLGELNF